MGNPYFLTRGQDAILDFAGVLIDSTCNLPALPRNHLVKMSH